MPRGWAHGVAEATEGEAGKRRSDVTPTRCPAHDSESALRRRANIPTGSYFRARRVCVRFDCMAADKGLADGISLEAEGDAALTEAGVVGIVGHDLESFGLDRGSARPGFLEEELDDGPGTAQGEVLKVGGFDAGGFDEALFHLIGGEGHGGGCGGRGCGVRRIRGRGDGAEFAGVEEGDQALPDLGGKELIGRRGSGIGAEFRGEEGAEALLDAATRKGPAVGVGIEGREDLEDERRAFAQGAGKDREAVCLGGGDVVRTWKELDELEAVAAAEERAEHGEGGGGDLEDGVAEGLPEDGSDAELGIAEAAGEREIEFDATFAVLEEGEAEFEGEVDGIGAVGAGPEGEAVEAQPVFGLELVALDAVTDLGIEDAGGDRVAGEADGVGGEAGEVRPPGGEGEVGAEGVRIQAHLALEGEPGEGIEAAGQIDRGRFAIGMGEGAHFAVDGLDPRAEAVGVEAVGGDEGEAFEAERAEFDGPGEGGGGVGNAGVGGGVLGGVLGRSGLGG